MLKQFPSLLLPALLVALCTTVADGKLCSHILPGLETQARGVDVTRLDLVPISAYHEYGYKSPVVEYTCDNGTKRKYGDVEYDVPDQVWHISEIPTGSLSASTTVMKTSNEVRKGLSVNAGVDVKTKKFDFSASSSYTKSQSTLLKNERKIASVSASFSTRRADLLPKVELTLGERAQRAVDALPSRYADDTNAYEGFIRQYGTHYIAEGKFGGIMMMYMETESSYIETTNTEEVAVQASATFSSVLTIKGGTSITNSQVDSKFTSATNTVTRYYGGTTNLMDTAGLAAWQPTIAANPWLFSTKLKRISDLVRDATKSASLDQAITDYVMRSYLTVELRRVLNSLPSTVKFRQEVTDLKSRIDTMSTKYPLVESEVDALGYDVMFTYGKLFVEDDLGNRGVIRANDQWWLPASFECPASQAIVRIESGYFSPHWLRDRQWWFKCAYLPMLYTIGNCKWSGAINHVPSGSWNFSCGGNSVIKGWYSDYNHQYHQRYHYVKCCDILDAHRPFTCSWTGYKNDWFQWMAFILNPGSQVLTGVYGIFSNGYFDERWKFQVCNV